MKYLPLLATLLFLAVGCENTRQLRGEFGSPVEDPIAAEFNNLYTLDNLYFAGYPTEAGLREMADRGVKVVVCTKTPSQVSKSRGFDEKTVTRELGMKIVWIPISPSSFNREDIEAFANALEETDGPMLIHCGSANTVGGLWAAYLHTKKDVPIDEAIEQGQSVGLHAPVMIDAVRRVAD